jgi:NitT/TauT family transport system permease protein
MALSFSRIRAEGRVRQAMPSLERAFPLLSALALLALWALASALTGSRFLPPPQDVMVRLYRELISGNLLYHMGATLARVAASFTIAMAIGSVVGIAMGRNRQLDRFFDGWLILFLNLPALVVIILCYVWFGLTEAAAVTAVAINKIPNVAVTLREGARAMSRDLDQMAAVYRFSRRDILLHVHLPQLAPYFAAAARSGLALVWKIVLVVELLGLSSGIGFELNSLFQLFDVEGILAYALSFIAVILFIEAVLLQPWQRRVNRWRA